MCEGKEQTRNVESFVAKSLLHEQRVGVDAVGMCHLGKPYGAQSLEEDRDEDRYGRQDVPTVDKRAWQQEHVDRTVCLYHRDKCLKRVHFLRHLL